MNPIVLVLAGFGAGLLVGWLIASIFKRNKTVAKLQEELEELQATHDQYKTNVDRHFVHTSNLVNNLTQSYKEVHQHLAAGAQTLCSDDLARMLEENTTPLISDAIDAEHTREHDNRSDEGVAPQGEEGSVETVEQVEANQPSAQDENTSSSEQTQNQPEKAAEDNLDTSEVSGSKNDAGDLPATEAATEEAKPKPE